jgi:ribose transport system substrate-binding protein
MKNKSALALAICLAAAAFLFGCARQQGSSSSNAGKKLRLAFVTNNASDFRTIARRGTDKADQELDNVDVEFRIPSDGTAAEQKRICEFVSKSR